MPMITREQILQEIKRDGIETIKNRLFQISPNEQKFYREVIQELESSEVLSRQETREAESLSISRKALAISEEANSISKDSNALSDKARRSAHTANIIAIIALAITIIMAIIEYKSKTP